MSFLMMSVPAGVELKSSALCAVLNEALDTCQIGPHQVLAVVIALPVACSNTELIVGASPAI